MSNEEKILRMLGELQQGQAALTEQQKIQNESILRLEKQQKIQNENICNLTEQQQVHNESILKLENSITHELRLLNENLPDAVQRSEQAKKIEAKVEEHDDRIFALEQVVNT